MSAAFKIHDLRCFLAVAAHGSFQAAAAALHRTHPSVFAAVGRLEGQLGLSLLDRSGYRVILTQAGQSFRQRAELVLRDYEQLGELAAQLATGEETVLRIVIGDLCPRTPLLRRLSAFFRDRPRTTLHLDFEAVGGPLERLLDRDADLVFHRGGDADPRLERIDLTTVRMVPVVAAGFLPFALDPHVRPEQLLPFTQCAIRDTARRTSEQNYFLIEGAHRCSVPDQQMKRDLIVHGLAWGHLPDWLIADQLNEGSLIPIESEHLPGLTEHVAAIRRRDVLHGPVAEALWRELASAPNIGLERHGQE
jgi:DNA-binding transcriptional LysR family regulator